MPVWRSLLSTANLGALRGRDDTKCPNLVSLDKEVSQMARFLVLWHINPLAPWPTNPDEYLKLEERMWAGIDNLMRQGQVKEFGYFADGRSGYTIGEGETADTFRSVSMFIPYVECEVHEIIPYEKGKEIVRAVLKAAAQR